MVGYILDVASLLGDVLPAGVSPDLSPLPGALQGGPQLRVLTLGVLGLVPTQDDLTVKSASFLFAKGGLSSSSLSLKNYDIFERYL